jgi:hypothetical protein
MTAVGGVARVPTAVPAMYRVEIGDSLVPPVPRPGEGVEWRVWHGDWWGQCRSSEVPGPYEVDTPASWRSDVMRPLIADGWKVVVVMRDGRNLIESIRRFRGGIEEQRQESDPHDYFTYLCKAFRNKARVILDARLRYQESFSIVKMEHLLVRPREALGGLEQFLGVKFEWDVVSHNIEFARTNISGPDGGDERHSSFSDNSFLDRSMGWSQEEAAEFDRIAGLEQRELGYPAAGEKFPLELCLAGC